MSVLTIDLGDLSFLPNLPPPHEDTVRRWPSTSQEDTFYQKLNPVRP